MKRLSVFVAAAVAVASWGISADAATKYWDVDGATPGPGAPFADGTWDLATTANWSTSAAGDVATTTWAAGDAAVFSAGSDPFDAAVTFTGVLDPASLTVENGRVILSGTGLTIGANPITVGQGGTLQYANQNRFTVAAGNVVTLDGGTLRNTIVGVGSGIYPGTGTNIQLTANGGTIDTPNGGAINPADDMTTGAFSIMVYTNLITMAPGTTSATLRKTGRGELRALAGWNFTNLQVDQGLYRINASGGSDTGFGAATGTVQTAGGAVENSLAGTALGTSIAVTSPATRSFILGAGKTAFVLNAGMTINGPVSGPGGIMVNGYAREDLIAAQPATGVLGSQTQILTLGGTNTYAGESYIAFGTLAVTGGAAIPDTSQVRFSTNSTWGGNAGNTTATLNTAVFRVDANETVGSLAGGNAVRGSVNINGAAVTLTTGADNTSSTLDGVITGTGGLTKIGTGTFTMTGANTYAGDTRVNGGTLSTATTSFADAADIYITTGATLNLNTAGGTDTVDSLFIDGIAQAVGTWGAAGSGATHTSSLFSGTGLLNVLTAGALPDNANFNGVGPVDGSDFLIWQRGFGTGTTQAQGDANHDNAVTGADLTIWSAQYGTTPAVAAIGAVPEPSTFALAGIVALAGLALRRRS